MIGGRRAHHPASNNHDVVHQLRVSVGGLGRPIGGSNPGCSVDLVDFVLVHGAYHGSWCWGLVADELVQSGHRVVSMDLPIEDPAAGLLTYRDAVLEAAEGLEAPVVVGHSMAGAVIPLVAESRKVFRLVFLCAFVPWPGRSLNQLRASEPLETYRLTNVEFEDLGERVWRIGAATARELFFHDVPDELATWAQDLLRPQSYGVFDEKSPLANLARHPVRLHRVQAGPGARPGNGAGPPLGTVSESPRSS